MIRSSIIMSVAILTGFCQVALAQYGGYGGGSFESGGSLRPTLAAPAPTVGPASAATGAVYGGEGAMAGGAMSAEGGSFGDGFNNRSRFGLLPDDGGMPQHYAYYPPMHGYYYFHPYHYSHVPAHQDFAGRIGIDPRNPYANDFFKTVYAEYRSSQFRADAATSVPMAPESPTEALRKLKTLMESGVINADEFNAKKAEILSRI